MLPNTLLIYLLGIVYAVCLGRCQLLLLSSLILLSMKISRLDECLQYLLFKSGLLLAHFCFSYICLKFLFINFRASNLKEEKINLLLGFYRGKTYYLNELPTEGKDAFIFLKIYDLHVIS